MKKLFALLFVIIVAVLILAVYNFAYLSDISRMDLTSESTSITGIFNNINNIDQKLNDSVIPKQIPTGKTLKNNYHIYQTFNNCGPAALSMALSYYRIKESQQILGQQLRPYQHPKGDNDDKSVTLDELADKSREYGLIPYHRPNGNIEIIKKFIANDIPVITRTWLKENDDIGHYRIVKGYDDEKKILIQDDSLQGKNLKYGYDQFNTLWVKYGYEYLVLIPPEKDYIIIDILGEDFDENKAWNNAVKYSKERLNKNPNDTYERFNLSVALYQIGDYRQSVEQFEKVKGNLSKRTLWYQIEPIMAYYKLGEYNNAFDIIDDILNNNNRAFSELYLIRGQIYLKQGDKEAALREFEKAIQYNENLKAAQEAMLLVKNH